MNNFFPKSGYFLLLLGLLLCTACSKTPLKGDELKYVGSWQSNNGSTLEILANGGGSCKKLGFDGTSSSSKSMSGAQVLVNGNGKLLSFKLMGIAMDFHVDAAPALVNGKMQMKLDGMDYAKAD